MAACKTIAPLAESIVPVAASQALPRLWCVPVRPPVRRFPVATIHYQWRTIRVPYCVALRRRTAAGGRGGRHCGRRRGGARPGMPRRRCRPRIQPRRCNLNRHRRGSLDHAHCPCLPRRDRRSSPPGRPRDGWGLWRGRMARRRRPGGGERRVLRPLLPGGGGRAPTHNSAPVSGASSDLPRHAGVVGTFCLTPRRRPLKGQLTARPARGSAAQRPLGRVHHGLTCASARTRTARTASFSGRPSFRDPACWVRGAVAIACHDLGTFGEDSEGVISFFFVARRPRSSARPGSIAVPFSHGPPGRQARRATSPAGTVPSCAVSNVYSGGAGTSAG